MNIIIIIIIINNKYIYITLYRLANNLLARFSYEYCMGYLLSIKRL